MSYFDLCLLFYWEMQTQQGAVCGILIYLHQTQSDTGSVTSRTFHD